jgi:hypothetical protein
MTHDPKHPATRWSSLTASESTPWPSPRDCRRFTSFGNSSKRDALIETTSSPSRFISICEGTTRN